MKVNFKKLVFVAASLFISNAVSAEGAGPSIPDVTVAPGGTATVSFNFTNSDGITTYTGVSLYLTVPTGFSIDTDSPAATERCPEHDIVFVYDSEKDLYKVTVSTTKKDTYFTGTSGTLFTFSLKCDETVANGNYSLALKDITFSYINNKGRNKGDEFSDANFNIIVGAAATSVDITLANKSSYNTYVSDKDLDFSSISADAEAYVVTAVTKTEATLKKVDAVPAGEGFIIKGLGKSDISVPVAATAPAATGTLLKTSGLADGDYLLAKDGSKFVLWDGTGTLPANKAFLPKSAISSSAKVITFVFDETTGINEVQKAETEGAIYNLNGMRVSKTQKGVYIMNGRKVIVK